MSFDNRYSFSNSAVQSECKLSTWNTALFIKVTPDLITSLILTFMPTTFLLINDFAWGFDTRTEFVLELTVLFLLVTVYHSTMFESASRHGLAMSELSVSPAITPNITVSRLTSAWVIASCDTSVVTCFTCWVTDSDTTNVVLSRAVRTVPVFRH